MENILLYAVIPVLTVSIMFFVKRKLLWTAPLISAVLFFITYMTTLRISGMTSPISKIFGYGEWRCFFLLALLIHFIIVTILTAIAYFIAYMRKGKKH